MMDRIGNIVADVNRYFRDLEKLSITKEEDLKDIKTFYASSMVVFSIINRAIDLGEEIITTFDLGYPTKYREIFDILENAGMACNTANECLSIATLCDFTFNSLH